MRAVTVFRIAGVDEAGRGPLAGPVVAAAVILDPDDQPAGLADSKILSASRRSALAVEIAERSLAVGIGVAGRNEIDAVNILEATMLAMQRAVASLPVCPERILVDGNRSPEFNHCGKICAADCVIRGDSTVAAISAASIVAKVYRDKMMVEIDQSFPAYGFARHKGYGTPEHREKLEKYGPCPEHRRSFAPVRFYADRNTE